MSLYNTYVYNQTYCIHVSQKNCSTKLQEGLKMKKPLARTLLILALILIVATQKYILLFHWYSKGFKEKAHWYEQLPSSIKTLINTGKTEIENETNFVHDCNSVELVIGLNEDYPNIEKIVWQKNGKIRNIISVENKICSVVVDMPLEKVSSFLADINFKNQIRFVEPNWKFYIDATPNDPKWTKQWGLKKIEANVAWNTQRGEKSVLVAIVDTGVDYYHIDLAQNYAPLGYDWVSDDNYPMDDHGHGTHCAGIVGAVINNSAGIAGVAQVRIMAEKAINSEGWGREDDLANAIMHAADKGAKIISCSWGSDSDSMLICDAVKYASEKGSLVIAAAGNSASNEKHYPAAYEEVIAVTATSGSDLPASFTTFGDWVDLSAPGVKIYSTFPKNQYKFLSGTSMACPHVAGVAALILSEFPTMTIDQVHAQLLYTADDLGETGFDVYYGYGRVNARKAVENTLSLVGSKIFSAPAHKVYFMYVAPTECSRPEAAYDVVAAGMIYGLSKKAQHQGFITKKDWLLGNGKINSTTIKDSVVVFVGGPCAQSSVSYYENAGFTLVKFDSNSTHYEFVNQTGNLVAALSREAVSSGHEDMFVIEVFSDEGNTILVIYGFSWKGTWAGGTYFKEVLSNNINNYSKTCYVFHWIDDDEQDGIPQSSETRLEYSTP